MSTCAACASHTEVTAPLNASIVPFAGLFGVSETAQAPSSVDTALPVVTGDLRLTRGRFRGARHCGLEEALCGPRLGGGVRHDSG